MWPTADSCGERGGGQGEVCETVRGHEESPGGTRGGRGDRVLAGGTGDGRGLRQLGRHGQDGQHAGGWNHDHHRCDLHAADEQLQLAHHQRGGDGARPGDPSINERATGSCAWVGPTSDEDGELVVDYVCADTDFAASAEVNVIKGIIGSGLGVAVSGVGDAAVWEETSAFAVSDASTIGGGTLTAVFGDAYIMLTLTGDGTPAELQARAAAVAKLVVSRL